MKPRSPSTGGKGRFPQTDYFFHSGFGQWRGHFWSSDGEDRSRFRNLFDLGREYRIEAARERAREMAAFRRDCSHLSLARSLHDCDGD